MQSGWGIKSSRSVNLLCIAYTRPTFKAEEMTNINWSLIITTLLFALAHGVTFTNELDFVFDPVNLINSGVIGFFIGWIRAYSGSIIPAILLHNGINLLAVLVPWLIYAIRFNYVVK